MNFFGDFAKSVESIFGSLENLDQGYPLLEEDDQSDTDDYEFPYSEKETNLINRFGTLRDLEGGSLNLIQGAEPAAEMKLNSKQYAFSLLTMTCGFVASAFSFVDAMVFIFQCPENWVLPCLSMLLGALSIIALIFVILKLVRKVDSFRRREQVVINTCFTILLLQWLMDVRYLMSESYIYSSAAYCSPKFYGYTIITNLIAVLAFLVNYMLMYIHRRRIN